MREKVLIIFRAPGRGHSDFAAYAIKTAQGISEMPKIRSCKLAVTAEAPPKISIIPYKKTPAALITLEAARDTRLTVEDCRDLVNGVGGIAGCYRGECVLPVAYEKDWTDGAVTPGAGLLTLFRKAPGLGYNDFIDRWHNGHTPLSLQIHPLWNYVRNVVAEKIFPESEDFHGIVEEHVRIRKDLTSPVRFFGGFRKMAGNMIAVQKDTKGFIDMKTIEPYFISEYWIKTPGIESAAAGSDL